MYKVITEVITSYYRTMIASVASYMYELAGAFLWYIYIFVSMGRPFGPAWAPRNAQCANVGPAGLGSMVKSNRLENGYFSSKPWLEIGSSYEAADLPTYL